MSSKPSVRFVGALGLWVTAIALIPHLALAQTEGASRGIEVAAGLAVARPTGKVASSATNALSYNVPAIVPISLAVGYRFAQAVYAGVLFSYAPGFTEHCPTGANCSVDLTVFAIELRGHLPANVAPLWASIGFGYESLGISVSNGGLSSSGSADGYQFLSVKLGGDVALGRTMVIAPYLGLDLARYDEVSQGSASRSIPDDQRAWHTWLSAGARLRYTFEL